MDTDRKKTIFQHLRKSLVAAGVCWCKETSLICPLCWQDTEYDALSIEHVIPSSVGGHTVTLSCERCNSTQGSALDAHVAKYQQMADALDGVGTIPAKMQAFGHEVSANLTWGAPSSGTNIAIVGKASNPAASDAIQAEFKKGNLDELKLTLSFGYVKNRFQTALLRSAYLVLFRIFGYQYAKNDVVQVLRRRIANPSLQRPDLGILIGEIRENSIIVDNDYYVIHGFMDDIPFFQVVIRLRSATESHQFVMMPVPHEKGDQFFGVAAKVASENPTMTFRNIPRHAIFTDAVQTNGDT